MNGILQIMNRCDDLPLPEYASAGSSGLDLRAAVDREIVVKPGARALVPTGLTIALPSGTEGQVRPRSGLAAKHGLTVLNAPGTIDEDYRGEVKVILVNHGTESVEISRGMRIAQLVVCPVIRCRVESVDQLGETERGTGGFGSSGTE